MKYIKIIFFAVVLFILVIFAHYNQAPTKLIFLSYEGVTYESFVLPLFAFFFIVILITIIVMSLLEIIERTSLRAKNKRLQKENAKLQTELTAYRQASPLPAAGAEKATDQPETSAKDGEKKSPAVKKKK